MQREGPLLKNGKRTSERMDKHVKADPKRSMRPKQKLFTKKRVNHCGYCLKKLFIS
jgi:aerobic-type carbon monoxide dehydrogenase small subunit (CoxS/CutS family)